MSSFLLLLFDIVIISGATRGLIQGENLAKRGPLASTQMKTWEMMVNLDEDGYTKSKTLNHRKIIRKIQKNNNLLKTKTIIKPKYKLGGGSVFTFSLRRGGKFDPMPPVSYVTGYGILYLRTTG